MVRYLFYTIGELTYQSPLVKLTKRYRQLQKFQKQMYEKIYSNVSRCTFATSFAKVAKAFL